MVEINGKQLCENCFKEISSPFCTNCGYNPAVTQSDPTMLRPGSILLGKYIVGKVIGKGGFGVTYLAYDVTTNRKVAIKEFFPYGVALRTAGTTTVSVSSMENANAFKLGAEKFYNEAKLVSKFNGNPNIVGVHEFFYENDTVYFAMEYLEGHTLKDHIAEHGPISAAQALFIMQNVANALMAAHSSNVLHRDISPDNIILCDNGDVKLIDFGAARQVVAEHSQSFSVILKPGFAPLEQYQKKGNQGPWTDIYSLGTTIYYSLTEDIPEDPMSRIDDDEAFSSNKFNINEELWAVISKAAGLKIEDRYADIFMLKNDLSRISFAPEPVIVPNEESAEQMPEFRTAVPFGMTQTSPETSRQPVAAGGVYTSTVQQNGNTVQQVGNAVQQSGAPSQTQGKFDFKEFVAKHKRAVFAAAGVLVVVIALAIIIPNAAKGSGMTSSSVGTSNTGDDYSNSGGASAPGGASLPSLPDTPSTDTPSESSAPYVPQVSIPSGKVYYSTLYDEYKPLYEAIYDGINNKQTQIKIPANNYPDDVVSLLYYMVMYDNPQFCYVSDFTTSFGSIKPTYINADSTFLDSFATAYLNNNKKSNTVDTLCALHDALITNVKSVNRYSTETCTSAYGALVDNTADDMGLSKAFCCLAQKLGLQCLVVDGTCNGVSRSWCRVNIDGTWYNVDVYGDMTAGNAVKSTTLDTTYGSIFHTYFLGNDDYMQYCLYTLNSEYNFLLTGEYAANSVQANYYIQDGAHGHDYDFFYNNVDAAYNRVLEWAAEKYKDGSNVSTVSIASFIADEVWAKVKSSAIGDLKTKYGVSVSGGKGVYYPDQGDLTITLTP